jgi:hypothetical protein
MARVNIQAAIEEYHREMQHHGMDMHAFHQTWHTQNRDPSRPLRPDENWGMTKSFGSAFLQMHHEMVKAGDNEEKQFMQHQSIVSWFASKGYDLPAQWDPLQPIPAELAFVTDDPQLQRRTENPGFKLPNYFTVEGISAGENPEPITGSRKLADFKNSNQLGCCIVYPHNAWHNAIGGGMMRFTTAIDDPVFYFGVHWHIDEVFDQYKTLPDRFVAFEKKKRALPANFTTEEIAQLKTAEELGIK